MILQLIMIVLLVGVAEAQQDIYTDCLHKSPDGTTYDICRMPDLHKILSESQSCEQKMKEAMRMADQYLPRDGHTWSGSTLEYCDNVCQAEKALRQARDEKAMLMKWHDVMKECVK